MYTCDGPPFELLFFFFFVCLLSNSFCILFLNMIEFFLFAFNKIKSNNYNH